MRFAYFLVAMLAGLATAFAAPESWADQKLPVRDGLLLWLDANAINAGRTAKQLPLFVNGAVIDHWPDASGSQRDLTQPIDQSRPRFQVTPAASFVRFDGRDDYLTGTNIRAALAHSTVCIVARARANPGKFRAFVSANATGDNDYTSGFNIDMGGAPSTTLKVLNAEGAGFSGERDLLNANVPLGAYHIVIAQLDQAPGGVQLFLDGAAQGSRERASQPLRIDRLTIGARHCASDEKLPFVQGFLEGDIAELLVFDRVISDAERNTLTSYLGEKHAALLAGRFNDQSDRPLLPVKDPPLVQMLVPGFSVRELPVALTNINCLRYRADGRLVAGGYNGKIWLLSDANGDGIEETADLYWESKELKHVIGMAVTPPDDPRGDGLFVATAGRILFIPDANRDGRGDKEVVVATGWEKQASPGGGGSVDALGLALGPDGSIYFALGTSAYNNAYLLDKDGRSHYQLGSERGTILSVTPDFARREIVCTGIRYPYGAAFNRFGDLFVTEQEGATWLPNGNPFDELLHIERGKHYGFPPRHPRHLPNVIDEPSTFDYRPQHQSACGLVFNGAPGNRAVFGPTSWADDVFVAGESRGKIWRTKLVRTAPGYVARTDLIACLAMLTVDLAISPSGNLVVACHSGAPDWGTGPEGAGKIFQIRFSKTDTPQPVAVWCNSPQEIRIAFDQPLDPARLRNLAKEVEITRGHHVAAGDRFETIRPGYQVVKTQLAVPRWPVPVEAVGLTPDRTTLILATPRLTAAEEYALQIPNRLSTPTDARGGLPQHNTLDLATNLTGLEAIWKSADGKETLQTWLPHLDFAVARAFTAGSSEHNRLWQCLQRSGTLTLRGQLNLWQMLHPPIQPGSQLDYTPPTEKVRVEISTTPQLAKFPVRLEHEAREGQWARFELIIPTKTDAAAPALAATWSTAADPRPRPFPLGRFLLPWATATPERGADPAESTMRELAGGNWSRGRALYFGKSTCHVCHAIRGTGGAIGPDLSNLIHRDLTTVLRDIRDPSAALNPDHLAYHVAYKDGTESVVALLGEEAEKLRLGDASGALKTVPRSDVRSLQPLTASLMPAGLLDALTATEQRDLLTFLLKPTLEPAPIDAPNPPPPRARAEVDRMLGRLAPASKPEKTLRVLLAFGPKDHGPGEHNYPLWAQRWTKLLALGEKVETSAHSGWPTPAHFASHDVIVFYSNNPGWNAQKKPELDDFIHRGGGVVFIHWAVEGRDDAPALADCIGLASNSRTTKYRHGPLQLTFPKPDHPITRGLDGMTLIDESYWQLVGDPRAVEILGEQIEDGAPRPQLWASERGAGRLFVSIPGHYTWSFDDPLFRLLLLRGICWSAKQPVDRLSELATIGARISETP